MKKTTYENRHFSKSALTLLLSMGLMLSSCLPHGAKDSEAELEEGLRNDNPTLPSGDSGSSPSGGDGSSSSGAKAVASTKILNFNQINMNFSKITGVNRGQESIQQVMSEVKNQLPSSNNISSYTAFTQISITRLAFSYCDAFIDQDSDFSSLNYGSVDNEEIINTLLEKVLDANNASNPSQVFPGLASELNDVLNNDTNDEVGAYIDDSIGSAADRKRRLTKMACTLTLSSSYVTIL